MPPVPPQDEQGLMQLVFSSITKRLRSEWHRRRKPQFGVPMPTDPSLVADPVPPAQLLMHFDSVATTTATSAAPASTSVDQAQAVVDTRVPVDAPRGSTLMTGTPIAQWTMPSLTRTFVVDGLTWALGVVLLVIVGIRFWAYDSLQAELYGDIEIVQTYVRSVLDGSMPWYFNLSSGPLYHYLIAPILYAFGDGYDQIKIASISVSFIILGFVYFFAKRYEGRVYGLLALAIAGTGSWLLIFSRLGNSQIFVPLVTISTVYFLYRYIQTRNDSWLYASAIAATCGLFSYPQSFVVAPVMWMTAIVLRLTGVIKNRTEIVKYTIGIAVGSTPFLWMLITDPTQVSGDYVTEKITGDDSMIGNIPTILMRGIGAYFTAGDPGFRSNAQGLPHIDIVSSVLLVVGLVSLARKTRRALAPLFVIPLVLLHVPSMLVLRYPDQVPSASRSLGAAPFVYLIVALGLFELYQQLQKRAPKFAGGVMALVLLVSMQINIDRYFVKYISGLPYNDVPIGREVLYFVERLSPDTTVYVVGSGWRYELPEPFFVQIQMRNPERLKRFDPIDTLTCEELRAIPRPAVLLWSFDDAIPSPNVSSCADEFQPMLHATQEGVPVFFSAALTGIANPKFVAPALQAAETPQDDKQSAADTSGSNAEPAAAADVAPTIQEVLTVNGVETNVTSSAIDGGSLPDLFDGDNNSMMRGANQNPFVVSLAFASPVQAKTLTFNMAGMKNFVATLIVTSAVGTETYEQSFPIANADQVVAFDLQQTVAMTGMSISFLEQRVPSSVDVIIHLREIIIAE
jgi:hypothetical protein